MSAPTPGSAEWLKYMTASKVGAVVGTSPWESRFSLWHRMAGNIPPQELNDQMVYGTYMEAAILKWWQENRAPDEVMPVEQWLTHSVETWCAASPDGTAKDPESGIWCPVEIKTGREAWEWGKDQSDGPIPLVYYDQVQWQMFVMESPLAYVAADVMMSLRSYVIPRDQERIDYLVAECKAFMASLGSGEAPDLDGSTHTYIAVRELHPEIDGSTVSVPDEVAIPWLEAKRDLAELTELEQLMRSRLANAMGIAQHAKWGDHKIAGRQARGNGTPYIVAAKNLPNPHEEKEAA